MDVTNLRRSFESHLADAADDTETAPSGENVRDEQVSALDAAHRLLVDALEDLDTRHHT